MPQVNFSSGSLSENVKSFSFPQPRVPVKLREKVLPAVLLLLAAGSAVAANITSIPSVTISPAAPSPGQAITVTWVYTVDSSFNNPHAEIVISNTNALQSAGTANQYIVLGDGCVPTTQVSGGCAVGTNVPAGSVTYSTTVTVPSSLTPGFTYYVIVGMKDYNVYMNPSVSVDSQNFASFTIPLPPPYITLNKVAQGSTANPGGEVLFTINYGASNVHTVQITDAVDPNFTILQVFNGGTSVGQNITWNLGNISSPVTGFVSFLAQVSASATAGQEFGNTANATSTEVNTVSNTAEVGVSVPVLTITKSAPASVNTGSPITYVLNYNNSGLALEEFENFDNGVIPPTWSSTGCAWNAAPGYLEETQSCATCTTYPYLQDSSMTPILYGVYVVDMMVDSNDCNNFDAVFNFNITVSGGVTTVYQIRLSGQKGSNSASSNVLAYDIGGTNIAFKSPPNMGNVQEGTPANPSWYTVKVQVCNGQVLAKVWPKGSLEPGAWDINYTGASVPSIAGWAGFQANRGPVEFDNLLIFNTQGVTAPVVSDVIPPNVTYVGASPGGALSGGSVTWGVGSTCGESSAVTWWGTVGACGNPVTNAAVISSASTSPVTSNAVTTLISGCITSTPTNTPSFTPTNTSTNTPTSTPTATLQFTATNTATATPSSTATASPTYTPTSTPTNSATASPTYTPTLSPTFTPTSTITNTPTFTLTPTITATPTATIPNLDVFDVDKNVFNPANESVSIHVSYSKFPGNYSLVIYNSAGEHIRTLDSTTMTGVLDQYYQWNGKNKYGEACSSGVYIFYLIEPFDRKYKRVLLIH